MKSLTQLIIQLQFKRSLVQHELIKLISLPLALPYSHQLFNLNGFWLAPGEAKTNNIVMDGQERERAIAACDNTNCVNSCDALKKINLPLNDYQNVKHLRSSRRRKVIWPEVNVFKRNSNSMINSLGFWLETFVCWRCQIGWTLTSAGSSNVSSKRFKPSKWDESLQISQQHVEAWINRSREADNEKRHNRQCNVCLYLLQSAGTKNCLIFKNHKQQATSYVTDRQIVVYTSHSW